MPKYLLLLFWLLALAPLSAQEADAVEEEEAANAAGQPEVSEEQVLTEVPAAEAGETESQATPAAAAKQTNGKTTTTAQFEAQHKDLEARYQLLKKNNQLKLVTQENAIATIEMKEKLEAAQRKEANLAIAAEIAQITTQLQLAEKRQNLKLSTLRLEKNDLVVEQSLIEEKHKAHLADMRRERERIAEQNALAQERIKTLELASKERQQEIQNEMVEIDLTTKRLQAELAAYEAELSRLRTDLNLREEKERWETEVNRELEYPENPYVDGVLSITDRRIELDGAIITGTADYVTRRIHYYNNQSRTEPIFLVINRSPGGSVMEGYRIIKAMQASEAPIHVLVKSFAASMSAAIVSMADHSYAYENAIILHHQPWSYSIGNLTQQREQIEIFQEWARRLHTPVAIKMGVSLDQFYERMYENNSEGDWQEFADVALELQWVDHVVAEVREGGIDKEPTDAMPRPWYIFFAQNGEEGGERSEPPSSITLPSPEPYDFYFLHNPQGFYRW